MDGMSFLYKKSSLIGHDRIDALCEQLAPEMEHLVNSLVKKYETDYAAIYSPFDKRTLEQVEKVIAEKKALNASMMIVVGIGGSNLGTMAVCDALLGKYYNYMDADLKVHFADTVDPDCMLDILELMQGELEKGKNVLINVVTKSGNTTETMVNFELILHVLKGYKPTDYHKYVVVTSDEGSVLYNWGRERNMTCLPVAKKVGGRFSVFSPVGLFPLGMLDVDIAELCEGAQSLVDQGTNVTENPAAVGAALMYAHYKAGRNIHDMFLFSSDLESLGKWYRQLIGESLGKEFDRENKKVLVGITPTVSMGTTDLHSVGQLYLGGPDDKFTTFVAVDVFDTHLAIPEDADFKELVPHLQGKSVADIMHATMQGVQQAYLHQERPFTTLVLPEKSAFFIGQFLQTKMLETIYLGYLLNINPFDQPNVELYKQETRKILAS